MNTPVVEKPRAVQGRTPIRKIPSPALFQEHTSFWLSNQPTLEQITLALPDNCVDEIDKLIARGIENASIDTIRSALPTTATLANTVREVLDNGSGAVLIDRFPAERYDEHDNRKMCRYFSTLLAPLMAQNFAGVTLYDVKDKKVAMGQNVRRSITNLGQDYHTDGGWHTAPARYIGLYCINNAQTGGYSRVTSLLAAYQAMLDDGRADLIQELSRNHPWDKQGEHGADESPIEMNPLFESDENGFVSRWYENYVRNGYKLSGETMDALTDEALTHVAVQLDKQRSIRFLLEAGQFQYVNNYTVAHAREAFEDAESGAGARHLIRIWHH